MVSVPPGNQNERNMECRGVDCRKANMEFNNSTPLILIFLIIGVLKGKPSKCLLKQNFLKTSSSGKVWLPIPHCKTEFKFSINVTSVFLFSGKLYVY